MRHRKTKSLLNRNTSWRKASLISLAKAVLIYQRITTTIRKAKYVQPLVEKLISLGKEGSLAKKREAYSLLQDHALVSTLFNDIAKRFSKRDSGFTRIMRLNHRRGDNASMALLELSELKIEKKPVKAKKLKEVKTSEETVGTAVPEKPVTDEKKPEAKERMTEKPPISKKPTKKFLGGLKNIFKKERDSL